MEDMTYKYSAYYEKNPDAYNHPVNGEEIFKTEYYPDYDIPDDEKLQPKKSEWLEYLYNSETGEVLGRNGAMWGKLVAFYLIFYTVIIGFGIAMFVIYLEAIVNEDIPRMRGLDSLLKLRPGLSMRPQPDYLTALIKYKQSDEQSIMYPVNNLNAFTMTYELENLGPQEGFAECNKDGSRTPDDPLSVCKFPLRQLGPCQKQRNFGYDRSEPCIILKMNNVYGWLPDIKNPNISNDILVECQGLNPGDEEHFGDIRYYPNVTIQGTTYGVFQSMYFPFLSQQAFRSPLVAVQFFPKRFVILMVRCYMLNLNEPGDSLRFELFVE